MDARRPPKRIFHTHLLDKIAQFTIDLGSATQITGLPVPPGPKSRPMPANHSLRADNGDRTCNSRKEPEQPSEQGPIAARYFWSLRGLPPQNIQLMAKNDNLSLQ